ncbi:3513_t:CDS:2 [Entrophospora sp. SA101]|nr:4155_t:CDS:2 [Entrophospora sp. SA101]CAJ0646244.1 3513_t:CDS:2 [Entrophospora sp. SA101]CAJ0837594.1 263_t:CDS:2 [Entrophospora sp. SA101]
MLLLKYNSLPSDNLIICESTMLKFLYDKLSSDTGMYFNVWDWSMPELYGIVLGMLVKLNLSGCLQIQASEMLDFIIDVEKGYFTTDYHSFYHAVDVVAMLYYMLVDLGAAKHLTPLDSICLMIAGLCHDIGHPGLNNAYQVNARTSLAIKYNNQSVLENHSCTLTMELLSKHELFRHLHNDDFRGMDPEQTDVTLKTLIGNIILATDMMNHYELLESLHDLINSSSSTNIYCSFPSLSLCSPDKYFNEELDNNNDDDYSSNFSIVSSPEYFSTSKNPPSKLFSTTPAVSKLLNKYQRDILLKVLLHAADLSNAVRPWDISKRWSDCIVEEFFKQGDLENQKNLPISPNMNREQAYQSQISLGFSDFVVKPYFKAFALFLNQATIFLNALAKNRIYWDEINNNKKKKINHNNSQISSSPKSSKIKINISKGNNTKLIHALNTINSLSPSLGQQYCVNLAAGLLILPEDIQERLCQMSTPHTSYMTKYYFCNDNNSDKSEKMKHTLPGRSYNSNTLLMFTPSSPNIIDLDDDK